VDSAIIVVIAIVIIVVILALLLRIFILAIVLQLDFFGKTEKKMAGMIDLMQIMINSSIESKKIQAMQQDALGEIEVVKNYNENNDRGKTHSEDAGSDIFREQEIKEKMFEPDIDIKYDSLIEEMNVFFSQASSQEKKLIGGSLIDKFELIKLNSTRDLNKNDEDKSPPFVVDDQRYSFVGYRHGDGLLSVFPRYSRVKKSDFSSWGYHLLYSYDEPLPDGMLTIVNVIEPSVLELSTSYEGTDTYKVKAKGKILMEQ